jgi:hypothetical protein
LMLCSLPSLSWTRVPLRGRFRVRLLRLRRDGACSGSRTFVVTYVPDAGTMMTIRRPVRQR